MKIFINSYSNILLPLNEHVLKAISESFIVEKRYEDGMYKYFIEEEKTVDFEIVQDGRIVSVDPVQKKLDKLEKLQNDYNAASSKKYELQNKVKELEAKLEAFKELHGTHE